MMLNMLEHLAILRKDIKFAEKGKNHGIIKLV